MYQFSVKTLTFLAQIYPKRKLGFEIQKKNGGTRIRILEISCPDLQLKQTTLTFSGPDLFKKEIRR